jgi:hypothetical protein
MVSSHFIEYDESEFIDIPENYFNKDTGIILAIQSDNLQKVF